VSLQSFEVHAPEDFEGVFAAVREQRPDGLLTLGDPLTVTMRTSLADFALKERRPAFFTHRQFVEVGGLASYGANFPDLFRRAAWYVDKILKGANAGDLPVQQPTKFELFLNLATAKALVWCLSITETVFLGRSDARCQGEPSPSMGEGWVGVVAP
jgi:putative ABC transport system substrate-binding protein